MARNRLLSNESGFTIIEVLIALAIFSFGLLAVGALQARSLMETGDVARKTETWTMVDERATLLKQQPFYQNRNTQTFAADLVDTAGGWITDDPLGDGRYTVHWRVEDDQPIGPQSEANLGSLPFFPPLLPGIYTVSKTITVVATRAGGNPVTDALAEVQFIKTLAPDTRL